MGWAGAHAGQLVPGSGGRPALQNAPHPAPPRPTVSHPPTPCPMRRPTCMLNAQPCADSWRLVAKIWSIARGMMPRLSSLPSMV